MKNYQFAAWFVTLYLLVFTILTQAQNTPVNLLIIMFLLAPFFVIWMVVMVLKYAVYKGKELAEDEIL
ncbi:hypothetical protein [Pinibacter aurantiacus]|uniref:Uncharacterized protein n=1 Tax=Pinibacter aurantiacus TaxID=2851599 RepID=A0A9E2SEH1_9BACT|nr:hypothetical protein [Pinibacter aurantiacus]MBV4360249.1 hypothetical protein [Pinibacter aurantiacus]